MYLEDDQFNQFLALAIQRSIQSEMKVDTEFASMSRMVDMMQAFNDAKATIGCPFQAAYHCPTFMQFLDKNECKTLKKYKKEQEEDDSDSHSNP
jgi:hypothetical protein